MIVAEREFVQITLHVLRATVDVSPAHAALELQEKVFDVVRREPILVFVFAASVQHSLMGCVFLAGVGVEVTFIRHEC